MRFLKLGVLAAAVVGIIGAFLPLNGDLSLWDRRGPENYTPYFVIGAFAFALVAGALSVASGLQRWIATVALVGFLFVVLKFRLTFFELFTMQTGGILLGVAAAVGVLVAAAGAWRPEPAR